MIFTRMMQQICKMSFELGYIVAHENPEQDQDFASHNHRPELESLISVLPSIPLERSSTN